MHILKSSILYEKVKAMYSRIFFVTNIILSFLFLSNSVFSENNEGAGAKMDKETTDNITKTDDIVFWLETSFKRIYPNSPVGEKQSLSLLAARNERISFQACVRNRKTEMIKARVSLQGVENWPTQIRRVGYVPQYGLNTDIPKAELDGIGYIPGLTPDPLYPEDWAHVGPEANTAFWINIIIPEDAQTGIRTIKVRFTVEDEFSFPGWKGTPPKIRELDVTLDVRSLVVKPRRDFPVTQWISADSIWEWYKIEPFSERFWDLADAYIADLVSHNVDVIYCPIFNNRHEILPRPAQLLRVKRTAPDVYVFDFSDAIRWAQIAKKHGSLYFEWAHFFTPAPTSGKHPQRIFEREEKIGELLWPPEISATSDTYRKFLEQFLPQFKKFLEEENILESSLFHCADEPDGEEQMNDYRKARALLKELAPWMKVMDAMSDTRFATERLTDMPVPNICTAPEFTKAGCPAWVYFCCGPRGDYLQRFLDTPLPKIRMSGWLFYKLKAKGFLHWGHNYWYQFCTGNILNPFEHADVGAWPGLPYGDPFVVYPGENGPIDSIRWEAFAESLQDYALLQSAGIDPDSKLLESIKDYRDFPKSEDMDRKSAERDSG